MTYDAITAQPVPVSAVEGRDPEALAAEIIESLRTTDPKSTAEMIGGSRDGAERLGLTPREPTRW